MAFKLTNLSYDGACVACATPTPASSRAWWDQTRIEVVCTRCRPVEFEPATDDMPEMLQSQRLAEVGVGGGHAADTGRSLDRSADVELPVHVSSWGTVARDERALGRFLDDAFGGHAVVLHDRTVDNGAQRGTIDHLVIAASGVWVVDAKSCSGVIDVRSDDASNWKINDLYVGRRNQTKLVQGMGWQSRTVKSLIEPLGMDGICVHPALCFTESDWSSRSNAAVVDGVLILSPDKLCSVASQPGWLKPDAINAIATQLSSGLPAATD